MKKTSKFKSLTKKQREQGFRPGSFGFHEMLDRTWLAAEFFITNVVEHPASNHPELSKTIKRIQRQLWELYQKVAEVHLLT
jgi:hypothetical protein